MSFLSGFIAIVGSPNVGKSTLLNRIVGKKLAITTPKPQTTRNRILGVYNREDCQMIFLDTPGIHRPRTALHRSMVESALAAIHEVDILLFMIEGGHPEMSRAHTVLDNVGAAGKPCILVINKIDLISKEQMLPVIDDYSRNYSFEAVVPISALKGEGVDLLLQELMPLLKPGPRFFPEEMDTDQSEPSLVAELVREKIFLHTSRELPYSCAVIVHGFQENGEREKSIIKISADVSVEKESQKGILIGKAGTMIRAIGRSAREDLEKLFGMKVYLDLRVKVDKNWSRDTRALRRLGY